MTKIRNFLAACLFLIGVLPTRVLAQAAAAPQMDSAMVKDGKIYVVVAVLVVIFIGIILFLIRMDRRLSKLERQNRS